MSRNLLHTSFGVAVGVTARLLLPGHHSISLILAASLSLAGALAAQFSARRVLPAGAREPAAFILAALGAIAALLLYAVVAG